MIGKKTNEIAGCASEEERRETEIAEKAHKVASFQCSVSSVQRDAEGTNDQTQ
jgi:hypothetical protein